MARRSWPRAARRSAWPPHRTRAPALSCTRPTAAAGVISQYTIDPIDGHLTPAAGPQTTGTSATGIAVSPDGAFAYVIDPTSGGLVERFPVNQATGALLAGTVVIPSVPSLHPA